MIFQNIPTVTYYLLLTTHHYISLTATQMFYLIRQIPVLLIYLTCFCANCLSYDITKTKCIVFRQQSKKSEVVSVNETPPNK